MPTMMSQKEVKSYHLALGQGVDNLANAGVQIVNHARVDLSVFVVVVLHEICNHKQSVGRVSVVVIVLWSPSRVW